MHAKLQDAPVANHITGVTQAQQRHPARAMLRTKRICMSIGVKQLNRTIEAQPSQHHDYDKFDFELS